MDEFFHKYAEQKIDEIYEQGGQEIKIQTGVGLDDEHAQEDEDSNLDTEKEAVDEDNEKKLMRIINIKPSLVIS